MVEVLVALTILATTLTAIFAAMRTCSTASHHTRMLTRAVFLAESLMTQSRLSQDISFKTTQGKQDPFGWLVQIAPTPVENLGAIHVQVKWHEQNRKQYYDLVSLTHIKIKIEGK